ERCEARQESPKLRHRFSFSPSPWALGPSRMMGIPFSPLRILAGAFANIGPDWSTPMHGLGRWNRRLLFAPVGHPKSIERTGLEPPVKIARRMCCLDRGLSRMHKELSNLKRNVCIAHRIPS